jgi:hypothetical protein
MYFGVKAQRGTHTSLWVVLRLKPSQDIRVYMQRHRLLRGQVQLSPLEKRLVQNRALRGVDVLISQRVHSRPIGL